MIVTESKKDEPAKDIEMINTDSKPYNLDSREMKSYLVEEYGEFFGHKNRANKNRQYYEQ